MPSELPQLPLVTIGVTAYNAEETIERAIGSALAQTWRPIEIVAVDDASTDGTWERLEQLHLRLPELRLVRNAINRGVAHSRNRIIAGARGEFIAFFDDDDESLPERVSAQLARLTQYERDFAGGDLVICHSARTVSYPAGQRQVQGTMGEREGVAAPHGIRVAQRILLGWPVEDGNGACPTCSQMARPAVYREVGGFDEAFMRAEDTDLSVRLAVAGCHFVGIAEPLVVQHMTRTGDKSLAQEFQCIRQLQVKHRQIMEDAGEYAFGSEWIEVRQAWLESRWGTFAWRLGKLAMMHPVLTARRLVWAMPTMRINAAFARFHRPRPASGLDG